MPFVERVDRPGYVEYWADELQVFHNPNAKYPLHEGVFSGVTQNFFKDGQQMSMTPDGCVLASQTIIIGVRSEATVAAGLE